MKRWVWLALAAGTTFGATALAQSQDPNVSPEDQLRARRAQAQASQSAAQPGEMQTLSGTVKSYKEGKKIVVTDASGKSHSLKLDESARVDTTSLKAGDSVTVMWMMDGNGKERVTSVSTSGATGTSTSDATDGTSGAAPSATSASPATSSSTSGVNGQMSSSTPGASTTGTPGASRMRTTPRMTPTAGGGMGMQPQPTPIPK